MGDHPRKTDGRRVFSPQFKRTQVLAHHLSRASGSPWVTITSTWRRRSSAGRPGGARTGPRPSGTHWRGSSPRRRRGRTQSREEGNADYERLRDASHEVDGQPHTIPGGTSRRALQVGATGSCMHRLLDAPACEGPRWARLMRTVCAARRSRGRVVHPGVILAFTRLQSVALATPPETLYLPGVHDGATTTASSYRRPSRCRRCSMSPLLNSRGSVSARAASTAAATRAFWLPPVVRPAARAPDALRKNVSSSLPPSHSITCSLRWQARPSAARTAPTRLSESGSAPRPHEWESPKT